MRFLLASVVLVAACTTPDDAPVDSWATFAEMSSSSRELLVGTVLGLPEEAALAGAVADGAAGCPQVSGDPTSGSVLFLNVGCTGETTDLRYEGGYLEADNWPGSGVETDPRRASSLELFWFVTAGPDEERYVHGSRRVSAPGPDGTYSVAVEMTVRQGSQASIYDLLACDARGCESGPDAQGFIDDHVFGLHRQTSAAGGTIKLAGNDVLTVDLAASADGCWSYALDGVPAGRVCR